MRFWWLIPVVLAVVAVATVVGWMLARRAGVRSGKKGWVANTGYLRGLPKYQALVRRTRASLAIAFVCFLIAVIATSVSAGAPVDRYVKHDKSASRDIVLCLDSSGSMLPYDSKIGGAFRQIISHFEGERISLQLWDAYSMTMFPLTDDYDMATDVLQDMSDTIDTGLIKLAERYLEQGNSSSTWSLSWTRTRRSLRSLATVWPRASWDSTTTISSAPAPSCWPPTTRCTAPASMT